MNLNQPFKRVALMGRQQQDSISETLLALYKYLQEKNYPVVFDNETVEQFHFSAVKSVPKEHLMDVCDLIIVVGGDGSLLQAAKIAVPQSLPVLGINRGRLGFLTDVYPHEFEKVENILKGAYIEEERFLLTSHIQHQGKTYALVEALNEIVLSPGNVSHMIEFEVLINNQFVCDLRADGLILSTPTGSTAYALSGGGPILHPNLNAIVLVPMFPHTLSNRPVVVDADSEVSIQITLNNEATPFVSGDGQKRIPIELGDTLYLQKKEKRLRLIHPLDYNYFQTLRMKLGWQSKNTSP